MSTVTALPGTFTAENIYAVHTLGSAIRDAINAAKESGAPQGLIVAVVHAFAHKETAEMVAEA
jgi:hypothetical protein